MSPRPRPPAPPTPAAPRDIRYCSPPSPRNDGGARPARRNQFRSTASTRTFIGKAVDTLGLRESGNRKLTEIGPAISADVGKCRGRHDRSAEPAGDLFQPRREVDRRPDTREVEPVTAANIAIEDLTDMQRQPEAEALQRLSDRVLHRFHAGPGFARGLQHLSTD